MPDSFSQKGDEASCRQEPQVLAFSQDAGHMFNLEQLKENLQKLITSTAVVSSLPVTDASSDEDDSSA